MERLRLLEIRSFPSNNIRGISPGGNGIHRILKSDINPTGSGPSLPGRQETESPEGGVAKSHSPDSHPKTNVVLPEPIINICFISIFPLIIDDHSVAFNGNNEITEVMNYLKLN